MTEVEGQPAPLEAQWVQWQRRDPAVPEFQIATGVTIPLGWITTEWSDATRTAYDGIDWQIDAVLLRRQLRSADLPWHRHHSEDGWVHVPGLLLRPCILFPLNDAAIVAAYTTWLNELFSGSRRASWARPPTVPALANFLAIPPTDAPWRVPSPFTVGDTGPAERAQQLLSMARACRDQEGNPRERTSAAHSLEEALCRYPFIRQMLLDDKGQGDTQVVVDLGPLKPSSDGPRRRGQGRPASSALPDLAYQVYKVVQRTKRPVAAELPSGLTKKSFEADFWTFAARFSVELTIDRDHGGASTTSQRARSQLFVGASLQERLGFANRLKKFLASQELVSKRLQGRKEREKSHFFRKTASYVIADPHIMPRGFQADHLPTERGPDDLTRALDRLAQENDIDGVRALLVEWLRSATFPTTLLLACGGVKTNFRSCLTVGHTFDDLILATRQRQDGSWDPVTFCTLTDERGARWVAGYGETDEEVARRFASPGKPLGRSAPA